ncbi:uncharacterized protein LOC127531921 [Acanthochromis polyacanthus]|uniref:uncharacterized protein LOC127531921 n=1 Tax=Acanthochromis polyacanthus TaxID=80966 RepID=UPI002234A6DD|nr:uncharacterized protein LOC127531921 [Acanthochromis polyacanthus]
MNISQQQQQKKRPRRFCAHCDNELCNSAYFEHKKLHFINGVWKRKSKRARLDPVKDEDSRRAAERAPVKVPPSDHDETSDDQSIDTAGEREAMDEIPSLTAPPSGSGETADGHSVHLFLDSIKSDPEDEEANICSVDVTLTDEEGESLADEQSDVLPNMPEGHEGAQPSAKPEDLVMKAFAVMLPVSPTSDTQRKLLDAVSGLSQQMAQLEQKLDQYLAVMDQKLEARMDALEAKLNSFSSGEGVKRKRRVHCPRIAETVRRLHNSEGNTMRYEPEQGLGSPRNEAVTTHLVNSLSASPDLEDVETDVLLSACKTHFETLRRNYRYSQPSMVDQAGAIKSSARSRQRRKRLLDARKTVLAPDEVELWRGVTADMMSDEEDGSVDGVSGWIVRPPSFRSQELSELCAALQARLEADLKYTALHHRRLQTGQPSDRMTPNKYDLAAAKRHFKPELMPKLLPASQSDAPVQ